MARDGAWTTEKKAAETRGAHVERVVEIILTDYAEYTPNTGWYTRPKTLYLTDAKQLQRTTAAGNDSEYWSCVLEWGDVFQEGEPGGGLASVSDTTLRLSNHKIPPQLTRGSISGMSALDPEPDATHLRLSDLFAYYNWIGATITVKLLWFEGPTTDQNSAAAPYQEAVRFKGVIANASIGRDDIALDITENTNPAESPLPRNEITNPPTQKDATFKAPVCYGNFAAETADLGGFDRYKAINIGLKGMLTPVFPYAVDGTDPQDYRLIWNDAVGPNTGWTVQAAFGAAPPGTGDTLYRYNQDTDSMTIVFNVDIPASGYVTFEDDADTTGKCTIYVSKRLTGVTRLVSQSLLASTGLTNPQNCIARNPLVYAELDLTNTANYINFRLPSTQPLGNISRAVDSIIYAWVAADNTSVDAAVRVELGLYAGGAWIGTPREITGTEIGTQNIHVQVTGSVPGAITAANLLNGSNEQPLYAWQWAYSNGTSTNDVVCRVKVKTAGSAGQVMRVVAGGISTDHDLQPYVSPAGVGTDSGRHVGSREGGGGQGDYTRVMKPGGTRITQSSTTSLYMDPSASSLDDASGTISGTASLNLESPAHIAAHMLLKWGEGCASTDLNLTASDFGSFRLAKTDLDKYLDDVTGGSALSWKACIPSGGDSTVEEQIARLTAQTPMMIQRGPDGVYYASVFPRLSSITAALRYDNSAGNPVYFHPNYAHPDSTEYGKPYSVVDFRADFASLSRLYTSFRVRYRRFTPTGEFTRSVYVDGSGYSVWSATAGALVTSGDTLGAALSAICAGAYSAYNKKREMVIEADTISDHATATALLGHLVRRFGWQPVIVRGMAFLESYDLRPGHVIRVADDMNNWMTNPQYGTVDWATSSYFVRSVRHVPSPAGLMVEFDAEEIVY